MVIREKEMQSISNIISILIQEWLNKKILITNYLTEYTKISLI